MCNFFCRRPTTTYSSLDPSCDRRRRPYAAVGNSLTRFLRALREMVKLISASLLLCQGRTIVYTAKCWKIDISGTVCRCEEARHGACQFRPTRQPDWMPCGENFRSTGAPITLPDYYIPYKNALANEKLFRSTAHTLP